MQYLIFKRVYIHNVELGFVKCWNKFFSQIFELVFSWNVNRDSQNRELNCLGRTLEYTGLKEKKDPKGLFSHVLGGLRLPPIGPWELKAYSQRMVLKGQRWPTSPTSCHMHVSICTCWCAATTMQRIVSSLNWGRRKKKHEKTTTQP